MEPEEWARYVKLDGRLKEERRLLKIIARQTADSRTEIVRAAVRDAIEAGEMPLMVGPGRKCSKYRTMEFNSRIEGLECVERHFEHFLQSPTYGRCR